MWQAGMVLGRTSPPICRDVPAPQIPNLAHSGRGSSATLPPPLGAAINEETGKMKTPRQEE